VANGDVVANGDIAGPLDRESVGLVLVSHSQQMAEGLAHLVRQIAGHTVSVRSSGGLPDGTLGTDGSQILRTIRIAANSTSAGTVVLMDIGSSVLAVRAAVAEL
jgi:dihydroxyacetone kinase DhaKLM complex PTS-EIIA-like component DhaM